MAKKSRYSKWDAVGWETSQDIAFLAGKLRAFGHDGT